MAKARKKRIIIIGNSAAGLSALEAFRKLDRDSNVLIIDKEPFLAYSRMITPYFILGKVKKEEELFLRTKHFYKEMDAKILIGKEVLSIDTRSKEIILDDGKKEPFDILLIAAGGSPNKPKIKGFDSKDIFVLRSLVDARKLKEIRPKIRKAIFLGGGLVSIQTLQALFSMEGQYALILKSDQVLSQTLDREASELVGRYLVRMGVRVIIGKDVFQVKEKGGSKIAILDDQSEIETDMIFAGKGVRPNIDFLEGSEVITENGIVVNDQMQTNIEGIYAAGDIAQAPDFFSGEQVTYGLWPSAVEQGQTAGKNMAGVKEIYPGNLKMNVTRIFAMPIFSIGDIGPKRVSEALVKKDEKRNIYRKICLDKNGIIVGAILVNQIDDLGILRGLIQLRKNAEVLKSRSTWKSPVNYASVYKNIL